MSVENTHGQKSLSADLTGYESYLRELGMSERHIGFLVLAPRRLLELFGCISGLEFLKDCEYKSKFISFLEDKYKHGQLKKYASGITHYRNYLVSIKILEPSSNRLMKFSRLKKNSVIDLYNKHCPSYYRDVEGSFTKYLRVELSHCKAEYVKKLTAYKKFAWFLFSQGIDSFDNVCAQHTLEFSKQKTTRKTNWNKLRCFLSFAFRQRYIKENLAPIIILIKFNVRRKKQYLKSNEIEQLLSSICRSTISGKRTYAIFLMMAKLGLRPSEPIRTKLSDVDWVNSRIFVRGKARNNQWMPMPQDVAEAIIDYLKFTPRGDTEQLFVQLRPPFYGFKRTYTLIEALRKAYNECGICPPTGDVRLNVFRHSFATKLLNSGEHNIFAVQSLLRHSTPSMTLHYAKYHSKKLDLFETEWPGAKP